MMTPIHVLCSNFTEIVRQEVGKTMRCMVDKKFAKCVFQRHFAPVWRKAPKVCRVACHVTLCLLVKFYPNRFRFAGVIPEK